MCLMRAEDERRGQDASHNDVWAGSNQGDEGVGDALLDAARAMPSLVATSPSSAGRPPRKPGRSINTSLYIIDSLIARNFQSKSGHRIPSRPHLLPLVPLLLPHKPRLAVPPLLTLPTLLRPKSS